MRHLTFYFVLAILLTSCESLFRQDSTLPLHISFDRADFLTKSSASSSELDTNDFRLVITSSSGAVIYDGTYGASPEEMMVAPGTYSVSVRSCEFSAPAFDSPVYGDDAVVVVKEGEYSGVVLNCSQMNSGVRLLIDSEFLTRYPDGVLFLKNDRNKLMYSYSEHRIAYFPPGTVSLVLSSGGSDEVLMTREIQAREILTVNVTVAGSAKTGKAVSVSLDTARVWTNESCLIGGKNGSTSGSRMDLAMSVAEARNMAGTKNVWVYGYVVGGDLSSSNASFSAPFSSRTNLLLASKSSVNSRETCISVQLLKGDIRDSVNLVDNPSVLGKTVFFRGDIVPSYYGLPGLQNITEFYVK